MFSLGFSDLYKKTLRGIGEWAVFCGVVFALLSGCSSDQQKTDQQKGDRETEARKTKSLNSEVLSKPSGEKSGSSADTTSSDFSPEVHRLSKLRTHKVYFKGSENQLDVFRIKGLSPGKTMLILGGIHGNEPGGYLVADEYAKIHLEKGELIVIPRANLSSIRANHRGVFGDMNRKFPTPKKSGPYYERVEIIKDLMHESDVLLNLHDGSGFYFPKWLSAYRNPKRFGQSVIIDRGKWEVKDESGKVLKTIDLKGPAQRVVQKVNTKVRVEKHQFNVNNTMTGTKHTYHPDMLKTATFYAVSKAHIPAFGVETSKFLPKDEQKVHYQHLVINAFLDEYGIELGVPLPETQKPKFRYLVARLSENQQNDFLLRPGQSLELPKHSKFMIEDVRGNFERGWFFQNSDGESLEIGQAIEVVKDDRIEVRKDAYLAGIIQIKVAKEKKPLSKAKTPLVKPPERAYTSDDLKIVYHRNDRLFAAKADDRIHLVSGDRFRIVELAVPDQLEKENEPVEVNLVGFIGNPEKNDGEDRGYWVDTHKDFLKRWSTRGPGGSRQYAIEVNQAEETVATFQVILHEPKLEHFVIESEDGDKSVVDLKKGLVHTSSSFKISSLSLPHGDLGAFKIVLDGKDLSRRASQWQGTLEPGHQGMLQLYYGERKLHKMPIQHEKSKVGR